MENAKCYAPQILVGTEGLPREQWLEYRRKGIGGSDAAAVLGISPFRTGRDLYYDKLNIVTADDAENWVQLEVGTLLEPLVAKIFAHKTGYKIYRRPFMFQHPLYPWMLADLDYMVYMIKYDSVFRQFNGTVEHKDKNLIVNGHTIQVFSESDAAMIPWSSCGAEYIIESTGAYNTTEKASRHFKGGAKKVILTAPGKDEVTPTFVMGVNHMLLHSDMKVVSNASCTTNCLAPLAKVVNDEFGIEQALMSTIHAATAKQKAVDSRGGSDWRTGRSILNNIIPSSTGAAKAVGRVIPELYGKMTGMSFRVPTADVSVVDLTAHLKVKTTYADICYAIRHASETYMKGIIGYTADQVVSTDLIGNSCPCIFDETAGIMLDNDFVKLIAWYDNEWGYSNMVVRLLEHMVAVDEGRVMPEKRVVPKDKPKEEPAAKKA
jgi:glyceraldehyde 3-phosphate dehydrogenase